MTPRAGAALSGAFEGSSTVAAMLGSLAEVFFPCLKTGSEAAFLGFIYERMRQDTRPEEGILPVVTAPG